MKGTARTTREHPRRAFTMVELLVVIAILTTLIALTVAAVSKVREVQEAEMTEAVLQKLDIALLQQWRAAQDDAKEDIVPENLVSQVAGRNQNRGRVIYMKARLRAEFPQQFLEIFTTVGQPKRTYVNAVGTPSGSWAQPGQYIPEESAALLRLALAQKRRGTSFNAEEAIGAGGLATILVHGRQMEVFVDVWGTPIAFVRWPVPYPELAAELNAAPYVGNPLRPDPLDPEGWLANPQQWWNGGTGYDDNQARALIGHSLVTDYPRHYTPFVMSAGPDREWGTGDEIVSFRLRQSGQRGD